MLIFYNLQTFHTRNILIKCSTIYSIWELMICYWYAAVSKDKSTQWSTRKPYQINIISLQNETKKAPNMFYTLARSSFLENKFDNGGCPDLHNSHNSLWHTYTPYTGHNIFPIIQLGYTYIQLYIYIHNADIISNIKLKSGLPYHTQKNRTELFLNFCLSCYLIVNKTKLEFSLFPWQITLWKWEIQLQNIFTENNHCSYTSQK